VISQTIEQPCLALVGPTAIGKTELSLTLAKRCNCEIVSVDSMQVYRYMDIGTAKASLLERSAIPHHLIDIVNPDENYDAARFAEDALVAIDDIHQRGKIPLLTGGTGLYLRALREGIFPDVVVDDKIRQMLRQRLLAEGHEKLHDELLLCDRITAERIHKNDSQRLLRALEIFYVTGVPWSEHLLTYKQQVHGGAFKNFLQIGLTTDRDRLYQRINDRCETMIENGLEDEVHTLLAMGYDPSLKSLGSIGYRHIINYINSIWSREETLRLLARDTRRYAKRQYTWFSKITELQWFEVSEQERILRTVEQWLAEQNLS